MAVVYRARDTELQRPVAVKLLAEHLASDEEFRERFLREVRLAGGLSHPNIVNVFDAGEVEGRPFMVMELVEGVTLADEVARRKRFPYEEACGLMAQACSGLEHAHEAGLVHRDIKPQNLILRPDGLLKIADFGIARAVGAATQLTAAGTVLGTAAYLAPEQAAGEQVTPAADIYSLGAVLYELITGGPPHTFDTLAQLVAKQRGGRVQSLRDFAPEVPAALDDLILRCLSPEPAARPSSAAALADELGGTAPSERPTVVAPRPAFRRSQSRRRLWPAAVAAGAVLAVAVGVLATRDDEPSPAGEQPAAGEPVDVGSSPADRARNLAAWIRERSE
jgi:serine/threonine-protein kinase